MEKIKIVVKPFYSLLIMTGCVWLVMRVFFSTTDTGEIKFFETIGEIFRQSVGGDEVKNEGISFIQSASTGYVPMISYASGVQRTGESVCFKNLLEVKKEDGTIVSGSCEVGFFLYLIDIRSQTGNSVLEVLSTEEIAEMEEIPFAFVYDKAMDELYFFGSGVYTVYVKIYDESGRQETYEFQLPVETM